MIAKTMISGGGSMKRLRVRRKEIRRRKTRIWKTRRKALMMSWTRLTCRVKRTKKKESRIKMFRKEMSKRMKTNRLTDNKGISHNSKRTNKEMIKAQMMMNSNRSLSKI